MAGKKPNTTQTVVVNEVDESMDRADRIIMRYIGNKPISEIAKLIGWKPEKVLQRKSQLINEVDVLDAHEKRVKIMATLDEAAQDMLETARLTIDEYKAGAVNAAVGAMKVILTQLNQLEAKNADALERLTQKRVAELLRLVDSVVHSSVKELADKHGLDEGEMLEVFQARLVEEAQAMEELE